MIARQWRGRVPINKYRAYLEKMLNIALPDYRKTEGNLGAWCLHRQDEEVVHFEMLSFWTDTNVIKAFAGDDIDRAYYYDFDDDFLIEKPATVRHFEVNGDQT